MFATRIHITHDGIIADIPILIFYVLSQYQCILLQFMPRSNQPRARIHKVKQKQKRVRKLACDPATNFDRLNGARNALLRWSNTYQIDVTLGDLEQDQLDGLRFVGVLRALLILWPRLLLFHRERDWCSDRKMGALVFYREGDFQLKLIPEESADAPEFGWQLVNSSLVLVFSFRGFCSWLNNVGFSKKKKKRTTWD